MSLDSLTESFSEALSDLNSLESSFREAKRNNLAGFSHRCAMVQEALENVAVVWRRFVAERSKLNELDIAYWHFIEMREEKELTSQQKGRLNELGAIISGLEKETWVDFLSLFLFHSVCLDKLPLLGLPIWGEIIENRSFSAFVKALGKRDYGDKILEHLYSMLGTDMRWVDAKLDLYRDKFIVHERSPHQKWSSRSIYLREIGVEHISYKGSSVVAGKLAPLEDKLTLIIPELKKANLRGKVDLLVQNLYLVTDPELKGGVEDWLAGAGVKSPDIFSLTHKIIKLSRDFFRYLEHVVRSDGSPYVMIDPRT